MADPLYLTPVAVPATSRNGYFKPASGIARSPNAPVATPSRNGIFKPVYWLAKPPKTFSLEPVLGAPNGLAFLRFAAPPAYTYVASGGAQSGGAAVFVEGITYVATGGARAGGTAFVIGRGVGGLLTVRLHGVAGAAHAGAVVRAQRLRVGGTRQTVIVPDLAQATTDADGVAVLTLMPSLGDAYRVTAVSARGEPLLDVSVLVGPGDAELHQLPPVEDMLAWH